MGKMSMGLKAFIKKSLDAHLRRVRIRRDAKILGSQEWAEFFGGWFDNVSDFSVEANGFVTLLKIGVSVPAQTARWLLGRNPNYTYCAELLGKGVVFSLEEPGLVASWNGARFLMEPDTLFILWELVVEDEYRCVLPRKPTLVFDIGMNVGFASLVFAARNPEALIVGFEPFGATFARAQRNVNLNPHLAGRIFPQNFGLSGHDAKEEWQLNVDNAAVAGKFSTTNFGRLQKVMVQLKSASACLARFLAEHPNRHCVVKMDCEGGGICHSGRLDQDRFLPARRFIGHGVPRTGWKWRGGSGKSAAARGLCGDAEFCTATWTDATLGICCRGAFGKRIHVPAS